MTLTPDQLFDIMEADLRRLTRDMEMERLQRELTAAAELPPAPQEDYKNPPGWDYVDDVRLPKINWGLPV